MDLGSPILELAAAQARSDTDEVPAPKIDLRLAAGEFALVDARHSARPTWLADLCCGLFPLTAGSVHFLGRDWSAMPQNYAAALRGHIGRVFLSGSWIGFIDVAANIMLPSLHHTRDDPIALRERATALSCFFGLPGLPLVRPGDLAASDLARAACVRAFLGGRVATARKPRSGAVRKSHRAAARCIGQRARPRSRGDLVYSQ